jgi:hypothetical protein
MIGSLLALAAGLAIGRVGLDLVPADAWPRLLPLVFIHLAVVLAPLGLRLGRGLLRLPPPEVLRRSLPPLLLAAGLAAAGFALLPRLLAGLDRPFVAFHVPQALVLTALGLLALRDVRDRPPDDVGPVFLVAILLVGIVDSFAPRLVWTQHPDPGRLWRDPILVLGESGALGVAVAVAHLALTRRARLPGRAVGLVAFVTLLALAFAWHLWPPFAALGFGIALGRAGEERLPVPLAGHRVFASDLPLALLAGAAFAPDLWLRSLVLPSVLVAGVGATLLAAVRFALPGRAALVTGPGLLFLGLTLAVRLDPRMGPLGRMTIDLALPLWLATRLTFAALQRLPTTKMRSSDDSR